VSVPCLAIGECYERVTGYWDGYFDTFTTCLLCAEIRGHFNCDGFLYGALWENLADNFFPTMTAGGPCITGLSPAAKDRLFEEKLKTIGVI